MKRATGAIFLTASSLSARGDREGLLWLIFGVLALLLTWANLASAATDQPETLPRFAALRFAEVNLRTGPGDRYPIEWVLTKKGLPVEILEKRDVWRKITDWQGTVGWVHERMLTSNRTAMILGAQRTLHAEPNAASPAVAHADPGVIGQLLACHASWCWIEAQGIKGWLGRSEIWGVLPNEVVE